jgi:dipeptidase E
MIDSRLRLLLISNSTLHGHGYLDHAAKVIPAFLGDGLRVLFVPWALKDHDGYTAKAQERFAAMEIGLDSIHMAPDPVLAVGLADAFFVGGGNTFRLLKALQDSGALEAIRRRVRSGIPYVGSSAGSNVAAPTIRTTNDMPIVQPASLDALGLIPFQINPHYLDPNPASKHMGETREERLVQYLEENEAPVVGLREGAWLRVEQSSVRLEGSTGARIFRRGHPPTETVPGDVLDPLVAA